MIVDRTGKKPRRRKITQEDFDAVAKAVYPYQYAKGFRDALEYSKRIVRDIKCEPGDELTTIQYELEMAIDEWKYPDKGDV